MPLVIPRLYAIIDPAQAGGRSAEDVAAALLAAGVRLIQLRDKHASSGELYRSAQRVGACVRQSKAVFIVNDRADVALAVDADGVHVGQQDLPVECARAILGPGKWVGYSTHVLEQVREADRSSAPYSPRPARRILTRSSGSTACALPVRPLASRWWRSAALPSRTPER